MKIDVNPKALGILPISDDPGPKNGQTALDSEKAKASALVQLSPLSERLHALGAEVEAEGLGPEPRLRRLIQRFVAEYADAQHAHRVLTEDVKFLEPEDAERVLGLERRARNHQGEQRQRHEPGDVGQGDRHASNLAPDGERIVAGHRDNFAAAKRRSLLPGEHRLFEVGDAGDAAGQHLAELVDHRRGRGVDVVAVVAEADDAAVAPSFASAAPGAGLAS